MPKLELRAFSSQDVMAETAAVDAASLLRRASAARPRALALTGTPSAALLYRQLALVPHIPWEHIFVFWTNERYVPHTDTLSHVRIARETLLDHVPIPPHQVFPIPYHADMSVEEAAARYDQTLRSVLGPDAFFDLAIMGMGFDGRTASLFPDTPLNRSERLAIPSYAPEGDPVRERVTCARHLLDRSTQVFFLVTGADKRPLLKRILKDGRKLCPMLPAACIRGQERLRWYVDDAANPHEES